MGIFSRLFKRKKKKSPKVQGEPAQVPEDREISDDVSLQEVNDSLDDINSIEKEESAQNVETHSEPNEESKDVKPSESALYFIKKHPEGWQVIKDDADEPYRLFNYQKEAVDFAKKENLDYRVYKADGTLRK